MSRKPDDPRLYGIGAVARLTGLTDHTIRVWERRYSAIVAARAPNGRRQYTEADVQKLSLLRTLTDHGIPISHVAGEALDELRRQVASLRELAGGNEPRAPRVAVLGDFLPHHLLQDHAGSAALEIRIADSSRERFLADLRQQAVDVIVLERPVLDADTLAEINEYLDGSSAGKGVIVYSFGRRRDIEAAASEGIAALQAPIGPDELRDAASRPGGRVGGKSWPLEDTVAARDFTGPAAARRFSPQQLANLSAACNSI